MVSKMPPTKPIKHKSVTELLSDMSKQELLAVLRESGAMFSIRRYHVINVKIDALTAKADAAFLRWKEYEMPGPGDKLEDQIAYLSALKERQGIYKEYERLDKKINKLFEQFSKGCE